jgi:hypothetical protein
MLRRIYYLHLLAFLWSVVPPSSASSSSRKVLDCKTDGYAPLIRYAVSTGKYLPACRRNTLQPFSFVRHHSRKRGKTRSLMTGIGIQSHVVGSVGGEKKTFTHLTWNCASHNIVPHTHTFYLHSASFRFTISPLLFSRTETLSTETPVNPDVCFLIYCTDQENFSKYVLRTLKIIPLVYQRSWASFCLRSLACCLLPCFFHYESDC